METIGGSQGWNRTKIIVALVAVIGLLMLCFCLVGSLDHKTMRFDTLEDAENAAAFERGWLPPVLPGGATKIVEINDLDTNRGKGSFRFPPESLPAYIEQIKNEFNGEVSEDTELTRIRISSKGNRWVLKLERRSGICRYTME